MLLVNGFAFSVICLWFLRLQRLRFRDPASYIAGAIMFFALVPSLLIANGITEPQVLLYQRFLLDNEGAAESAVLIETIAVLACIAGSVLARISARQGGGQSQPRQSVRAQELSGVAVALIAYLALSLVLIALSIPRAGFTKYEVINSAPFHYKYLALSTVMWALALMVRGKFQRNLYLACASVNVVYCILNQERDFALLAVGVGVALFCVDRLPIRPRTLVILSALVLGIFSALGASKRGVGLWEQLSGGSISFIDSVVTNSDLLVGSSFSTYWDSFLRVFGFETTDADLSSRFVYEVAGPDSTAGYGFSVIGEAYLNGGVFGVVALFMIVCFALEKLRAQVANATYAKFFYVLLFLITLNALRNNSQGLISSLLHSIAIYVAIIFLSKLLPNDQRRPSVTATRLDLQSKPPVGV